MTTSKLFDRIATCSLAFRHARGDGDENTLSSYERVVRSQTDANLDTAAASFLRAGFPGREPCDLKVSIALCVARSIADGRAEEDGLVKAICDRFRGLEDFDHHAMEEIFSFSSWNDRVGVLLDEAMVLRRQRCIMRDIWHESQAEFILLFFDMLASVLGRGKYVDGLGYVTCATPSDMRKARSILEEHLSSIAVRCGACFKLDALKKARPRVLTIGREHIDFEEATVDTLNGCLADGRNDKGEFLDIIFAIISHSHREPCETYAGIRRDTIKTFFLKTILDKKTEASGAMEIICKTPQLLSLKMQLRKANRETACVREELVAVKELCDDKGKLLVEARKESLRLKNRVKSETEEVAMWKAISHTPKEESLGEEIAALKQKWDESRRDADNLRRVDAKRKHHLQRVISLNEHLEKRAAELERRAKQASRDFCARAAKKTKKMKRTKKMKKMKKEGLH